MRTSDTLPRSSDQLLRCSWPGDPTWFGFPNTERRATSLQSSSFSMVTGCPLVCLSPSVAYALHFRQRPVREPRGAISDRPEVRQAITFRVRLPRRGLVLSSLIVWLPH
jgi:hypothetical protein